MESVCRVILDSSRYPCPAAAEGGEQLRPSAAALYRPVADAFVSLGKMHFDWEQHSSPGLRRGLESVLGSAELDRGVAVKLLHGLALMHLDWHSHLPPSTQDRLFRQLAE